MMRRVIMVVALLLAGCTESEVAVPQTGDFTSTEGAVTPLYDARGFGSNDWEVVRAVRYVVANTTTTAPPPPMTVQFSPTTLPPATSGDSVWDALARCETGRNGPPEWDYNPATADWGSRIFEGGLQFHPTTWRNYKLPNHPPHAFQATREEQIVVGKRVQAEQGWGAWPDCAAELGLL